MVQNKTSLLLLNENDEIGEMSVSMIVELWMTLEMKKVKYQKMNCIIQ